MKKLIAGIAALMLLVCGCTAAFADLNNLTREEAMKVALDYTGLKDNQVTFTKAQMDREDGRKVWEIKFISNGIEYEYDVDVRTGLITKADRDRYPDFDHDDHYDHDDIFDDWFDFD